ncbi:MAG: FecR domain-containing protein [Parvibaculaceae bacterium]|nr:FecR domain-containing protein [Parvibaculaceae bacterium]
MMGDAGGGNPDPNVMGRADDAIERLAPLEREAQAWVMRFASGEATPADIEALKQWHGQSPAHAEAFVRASRLWDALGAAGQRAARQNALPAGAEVLPFIQRPAVPRSIIPQSMGRRAFLGGALAASAAGIGYLAVRPPLDLWPSFVELTADYRTATGEQRQIRLASGVAIVMSAQTSVAMRPREDDAGHVELIAGEATITTGRNASAPFVLVAGGGRTSASQASFDVRYIGPTVCVTCLHGEVLVEQGRAARALQASQQLVYSAQGLSSIRAVDPAVVTAWRDGFLVFHGTPLAEAVEEINRYRRGKIIVTNEALGRRLFNARFRFENVDEVVGQIQQVFGAGVTSLPGGIVLLS